MSNGVNKFRISFLTGLMFCTSGAWACEKPETKEEYITIYCPTDGFHKVAKKGKYKTRYGVIDSTGKIIVPPVYGNNIMHFSKFKEGVFLVDQVYYNKEGTKINQRKYAKAEEFNEGRAKVGIRKNGTYLYGFIDKQGNEVVPLKYPRAEDFYGGRSWISENKKGPYGFINKEGQVVIPLQYDSLWGFSEGTAAVKYKGQWMYIDSAGKVVLKMDGYQKVKPFKNGLAVVKKNGRWGYIDRTGKEVIKPKFSDAWRFYKVGNKVLAKVKQGKSYGYIDTTGKEVIPIIYSSLKTINNGYIIAKSGRDDPNSVKWGSDETYGILNNQGKAVVPMGLHYKPRQLYDLKHLYLVDLGYTKPYNRDDKRYFNSKTGTYHQDIYNGKNGFNKQFFKGLTLVKQGKQYGYMNTEGELQIPSQYLYAYNFGNNGLAKIKNAQGYNFIDINAKPISSRYFDSVSDFSAGLSVVSDGNKEGYMNESGKVVIPIKFDSAYPFENGKAKAYYKLDGYYPSQFQINKQGKILTTRQSVAKYQKSLKAGSNTPKGMVIEIKGNLIKIQDDSRQCSQRNYKNQCMNWINTPTEKWIKRNQITPSNYY